MARSNFPYSPFSSADMVVSKPAARVCSVSRPTSCRRATTITVVSGSDHNRGQRSENHRLGTDANRAD